MEFPWPFLGTSFLSVSELLGGPTSALELDSDSESLKIILNYSLESIAKARYLKLKKGGGAKEL